MTTTTPSELHRKALEAALEAGDNAYARSSAESPLADSNRAAITAYQAAIGAEPVAWLVDGAAFPASIFSAKADADADATRLKEHQDKHGLHKPITIRPLAYATSASADTGREAWPVGTSVRVEHDGFAGTVIGHYRRLDGYEGAVVQQDGTKVVHVYGIRHLLAALSPPTDRSSE